MMVLTRRLHSNRPSKQVTYSYSFITIFALTFADLLEIFVQNVLFGKLGDGFWTEFIIKSCYVGLQPIPLRSIHLAAREGSFTFVYGLLRLERIPFESSRKQRQQWLHSQMNALDISFDLNFEHIKKYHFDL